MEETKQQIEDKIEEKLSKEIENYCVKNPDKTVKDIVKKYKVTPDIAFYLIFEASKRLKQ